MLLFYKKPAKTISSPCKLQMCASAHGYSYSYLHPYTALNCNCCFPWDYKAEIPYFTVDFGCCLSFMGSSTMASTSAVETPYWKKHKLFWVEEDASRLLMLSLFCSLSFVVCIATDTIVNLSACNPQFHSYLTKLSSTCFQCDTCEVWLWLVGITSKVSQMGWDSWLQVFLIQM